MNPEMLLSFLKDNNVIDEMQMTELLGLAGMIAKQICARFKKAKYRRFDNYKKGGKNCSNKYVGCAMYYDPNLPSQCNNY